MFLGGWGGDISSSDSRAFYKFLQKIQANWIKFIFTEKKYGHIMDVFFFFFPLSKVAGLSLLSITWRAKKKEVYTIVFHGYIQMYFQREIFLTLFPFQYFMEYIYILWISLFGLMIGPLSGSYLGFRKNIFGSTKCL